MNRSGAGRDCASLARTPAVRRVGDGGARRSVESTPRLRDFVPEGGRPLSASLRSEFGARLGFDFRRVRIHDGDDASAMARSMAARAYTVGDDVVFGAGAFSPSTREGRAVLAHELAHVAQLRGASVGDERLRISGPSEPAERAADAAAATLDVAPSAATGLDPAARALSPSAPALFRKPVGSNDFGDWDVTQDPFDAGVVDANYHDRARITFKPNATAVNASEIVFLQADRVVDGKGGVILATGGTEAKRLTTKQWSLDVASGPQKNPWYGVGNTGKPESDAFTGLGQRKLVDPGSAPVPLKSAVMRDEPHANIKPATWSFESAAVARSGVDASQVYGAVTWGFDVDAAGKVKLHTPELLPEPRPQFRKSVEAWNAQAAGPAADRNAPDQKPIPTLKY